MRSAKTHARGHREQRVFLNDGMGRKFGYSGFPELESKQAGCLI